jgi:RNA polymerase sigma factor (sigma-70 family)
MRQGVNDGRRHAGGGPDLIRMYLDEIGSHPLLDHEDEVRLAQAMERGVAAAEELARTQVSGRRRAGLVAAVRAGQRARRTFIESNLRLVVSIAATYRRSGTDLSDLIQEGNLALMHAVERFDWRRGHKFSTYATWWIRKAVSETAGEATVALRVPRRRRDQARAVAAATSRLEQRLGRRPSRADVAEEEGLERSDVEAIALAVAPRVSLSTPIDDGGTELGDLLADESSDTEHEAEIAILPRELEAVVGTLSPVAARVLRLRYGLDGEAAHSIRQVAEALSLSPERIRQIEMRALLRLRRELRDVDWAS